MGLDRLGKGALLVAVVIAIAASATVVSRSGKAPTATDTAAPETPEQALAGLERGVEATPNDLEAWRKLAWGYFSVGRYPDASRAYARAVKIDPNRAELWSALGESLALSGKGDVPLEAQAAFKRALTLDPKDPRARYFLAVARDMRGDHQGAIDDWLALLAEGPPSAPWYADVRRAVEQVATMNRIDIADRLARLPGPALATGDSGATAAIPGPTREEMQAAAAMKPSEQQAMVDGMVASLSAKLESNPANVDGWIMLMRSYQTLGRTADARSALTKAKRANPAASARLDGAAGELGL